MSSVLFALLLLLVLLPMTAQAAETQLKSAGRPHTCTEFYPQSAVADRAEGTTTLSFRITDAGATKAIAIAKSSGNAELDTAAVLCVSGWRYLPAKQDGKPIEVPWQANVQWKLSGDDAASAPVPADAHVCRNYPHSSVWREAQGKAVVNFQVMPDGTVQSAVLAQSTGDADLDAAALSCVAAWHYKPALRDGQPVQAAWAAQVEWTMRDDLPPSAPCARYAEVTPQMLAGIAGATKVSFRIMPDGSVAQAEVLRSSGSDTLDRAALRCMSDRHFDVLRAKIPAAGISQNVIIDWRADLAPHG